MKLKFLFFFLALLLTAVWTILLVLTLKERGALFYIGEGVITFSLVFLVYFYRKVVKPLDIIGNGMEHFDLFQKRQSFFTTGGQGEVHIHQD